MSHVLYRMYASNDALLYVGRTVSVPKRFADHRGSKDWWGQVARIEIEHLVDADTLAVAERDAIERERPRWNVMGNPARVRDRQPASGCLDLDTLSSDALALVEAAKGWHRIIVEKTDLMAEETADLSKQVRELHRDHAMSYADIGAILGVSKTRAYQLAQQQGRKTPAAD